MSGNPVTLHDEANWPSGYSVSLIGEHTLETNPVFVNAVGKDFILDNNSPCIDAGKPDVYGNLSHIGFYETTESVPDEGGGGNVQVSVNVQYGPRNVQYG